MDSTNIIPHDKNEGKKGCLIAIDISPSAEINYELAKVSDSLKSKFPDYRYLMNQEYHCTLKFIGNREVNFNRKILQEYFSLIRDYLKRISPFTLKINGISYFPDCAFAKVFSPECAIYKRHEELCKLFPEISPFENDNFVPHITLLHFPSTTVELLNELEMYSNQLFGEMRVTRLNLKVWNRQLNKLPEIIENFVID